VGEGAGGAYKAGRPKSSVRTPLGWARLPLRLALLPARPLAPAWPGVATPTPLTTRPSPPAWFSAPPAPPCHRVLLEPAVEPRCRLDAGSHGTMGVGLGYALAAACVHPDRCVVAVEGDSAFGFSGMECETICRCGGGGGGWRGV
jgi:hypothetical protein